MSDDRGPGFAVNLSLFGDSTSGKARTQPKKPPKHFFPDCQPAALGQITASKAVQDAIANGRLPSCAIRQLSLDPLYHDITSSVPQRIEPKDAPRTEVPDRMRDGSDGPAPVSSDAKVKSSNPEYCEAISEPTLTPDASTDKKRDKKLRKQNVKATESCSPGKSPECLKAKGRDTIDISPTSIVIGEFVDALMTKKLTGLFKLRLPLSQKGAQRVAETLRIHVVRRNNKYELVGGYVSLKVILASDEIPTTIAAEIHNRVTKEDIAEWADTESRFIPLLFRLQQEQENTGRMADVDLPLDHDLFAVQRPRSKRTRRDEAFIEDLVNTIQSPAGRRFAISPVLLKQPTTFATGAMWENAQDTVVIWATAATPMQILVTQRYTIKSLEISPVRKGGLDEAERVVTKESGDGRKRLMQIIAPRKTRRRTYRF